MLALRRAIIAITPLPTPAFTHWSSEEGGGLQIGGDRRQDIGEKEEDHTIRCLIFSVGWIETSNGSKLQTPHIDLFYGRLFMHRDPTDNPTDGAAGARGRARERERERERAEGGGGGASEVWCQQRTTARRDPPTAMYIGARSTPSQPPQAVEAQADERPANGRTDGRTDGLILLFQQIRWSNYWTMEPAACCSDSQRN